MGIAAPDLVVDPCTEDKQECHRQRTSHSAPHSVQAKRADRRGNPRWRCSTVSEPLSEAPLDRKSKEESRRVGHGKTTQACLLP